MRNNIQFNPHVANVWTRKSKTIALLVEDISDSFFSQIARKLEIFAFENGYKLFCSSHNNSTAKAKEIIRKFTEEQVDGFIIAPCDGLQEEINHLVTKKRPLVLFDRYYNEINTNNVVIDNLESTYNAVKHLQSNGYQNIAFVTIESKQLHMVKRLEGYLKGLSYASSSKLLELGYKTADSEKTINEIGDFLIENTIDAVIFSTNYLALHGLTAMRRLNRSNSDLGIVAFDDHEIFNLMWPSITAITQPVQAICDEIMKVLLNEINIPSGLQHANITVPAYLSVRGSSQDHSKIPLYKD